MTLAATSTIAASHCTTPRAVRRIRLASASGPRALSFCSQAGKLWGRPDRQRVLEPCLLSQARLVATAGEAFSISVAGSHERAKPQSLNEGSPRDERFS